MSASAGDRLRHDVGCRYGFDFGIHVGDGIYVGPVAQPLHHWRSLSVREAERRHMERRGRAQRAGHGALLVVVHHGSEGARFACQRRLGSEGAIPAADQRDALCNMQQSSVVRRIAAVVLDQNKRAMDRFVVACRRRQRYGRRRLWHCIAEDEARLEYRA